METLKTSLSSTNLFSNILIDYLSGEERLQQFYHRPPTLASFEGQLEEKQRSQQHRKVLHTVLTDQYKALKDAPQAQIASLLEENTFTVTTGHQLNILGGPLYFMYKLVSTINLANQLKVAYPAYNFVPVYWMASEDHDFDEINHIHLFGKEHTWQPPNPSGAVGRLPLTGMEEVLQGIGELPEFLLEAYRSENLAQATLKYVHQLFGNEGLLVLNADDARLKRAFLPQLRKEVFERESEHKVKQASDMLGALGYKTQVFPRPINLFYLKEGLRQRLHPTESGGFEVINTDIAFSAEELAAELEAHPERFSPNVVLRPLYQEVVLPNLAYLGGPAEVAYWLQLKEVFKLHEVPFPVVLPRNFALVMGNAQQKKLHKLELDALDFFKEEHELKQKLLLLHADIDLELKGEKLQMASVFESITEKASAIDKSLEGFVAAQRKNFEKQLGGIQKKLKKAEEHNQSVKVQQLLSLKEKLFPNGVPQERRENFLNFYLNDREFLNKLLNAFDPLDFQYYLLLL